MTKTKTADKVTPTRKTPRAGDLLIWPDKSKRKILRVVSPQNRKGDGKLHILYENENVIEGKTWMFDAESILAHTGIYVKCSNGETIRYDEKPSKGQK